MYCFLASGATVFSVACLHTDQAAAGDFAVAAGQDVGHAGAHLDDWKLFPPDDRCGKTATTRTVDTQTFVVFKCSMVGHALYREPIKRRRDLLQAQTVQEMLDVGLVSTPVAS